MAIRPDMAFWPDMAIRPEMAIHSDIFGLTPLSGDRRGYMPPLLKTKIIKK